jgi:hypothetical protein
VGSCSISFFEFGFRSISVLCVSLILMVLLTLWISWFLHWIFDVMRLES